VDEILIFLVGLTGVTFRYTGIFASQGRRLVGIGIGERRAGKGGLSEGKEG
jgi:hypothetical protein